MDVAATLLLSLLAGCASTEHAAACAEGYVADDVGYCVLAEAGVESRDTCAEARTQAPTDGANVGGQDHGSPENRPYDIADFDDVESCAACHPQHYDEWQGSIHAYSALNPVMWAGSASIGMTTDMPRVCVGCHAPVATLTGDIDPTATVLSSIAQLRSEASRRGVSCVSCHKLYDVVNGVNQFTQCADWYAGTIVDPVDTPAHANHLSPVHADPIVCRSCHNVENLNHVQVEFTYSEWEELARTQQDETGDPEIRTCQDCHMETYEGPAAVGGPTRTLHRHTFFGGDVAFGDFPDAHRQYHGVERLLRDAATLRVGAHADHIEVNVRNAFLGHDLPTGSAFDRQVWVEILVTGADGTELVRSGDLDGNGDLRDAWSELDPGGDPYVTRGDSVFRSYLYDAEGQPTFDFIGAATGVVDRTLPAGGSRTIRYTYEGVAVPPLTVEARVLYRAYPPFLLRELGIAERDVLALPIFTVAEQTDDALEFVR
jgi:nitrate/TMAO reductase-like tetraheme cytochrome c subunit